MDNDYARIERAIRYLSENAAQQPTLEDLAREIALSPFHLQRLFRRYAGVSPKQFLQHLTLERAKDALDGSRSVLDAAFESGLSGAARLHDHFVTLEAVTPGEYRAGGAGLEIVFGFASSPFGRLFAAQTARGICALSFLDGAGEQPEAELRNRWFAAGIGRDDRIAQQLAERLFSATEGHAEQPLRLLAAGTNFQIQVWRALLEVPYGAVRTYREIAQAIGAPRSPRAVGNALAANQLAYLIPCHRVILGTGSIGHYRWQPYRKRALLAWERANALAGQGAGRG